jgi:hypothetical protein
MPQALIFYLRRDLLTIGQALTIAVVLALLTSLVLVLLWPLAANPSLRAVGPSILLAFGLFQVVTNMTRSAVLAKHGGIKFALSQAVYPAVIFLGATSVIQHGIDRYFALFGTAALISSAIQFTLLGGDVFRLQKRVPLALLVDLIRFGLMTFAAFIASAGSLFWLNSRIVGDFGRYGDLANFGVSYQLLLIGLMPANLLAPLIFQRYADADISERLDATKIARVSFLVFSSCVAATALLQAFLGPVISIAFGPSAIAAQRYASLMLISLPFSFGSTILLALLLAKGCSRDYCSIHVTRAVIIILGAWLSPYDRVWTAVTVVVAADIVACMGSAYRVRTAFGAANNPRAP